MAFEARNRILPHWFTRVRTRQIALPRFQRFEAWGHADVTQLFNTVLQGLPIGAVLVLEIGETEPFLSRTIEGAPVGSGALARRSAADNSVVAPPPQQLEDRTYFVYFQRDEETGAPYFIDSIARWKKDGDKELRPFWANKPHEQWARRMIPLKLCEPSEEGPYRFREWAREAIEDRDERDFVGDEIAKIRTNLTAFNLPYL